MVADRPGHDRRYAIDSSKLQQSLGWQAEHSFETGIDSTIDWYLANDWWWKPIRQAERYERLGQVSGTTGGDQ